MGNGGLLPEQWLFDWHPVLWAEFRKCCEQAGLAHTGFPTTLKGESMSAYIGQYFLKLQPNHQQVLLYRIDIPHEQAMGFAMQNSTEIGYALLWRLAQKIYFRQYFKNASESDASNRDMP